MEIEKTECVDVSGLRRSEGLGVTRMNERGRVREREDKSEI